MTNHTTITGREIKTTANFSKRTFTIRTDAGKYRTSQMSKEQFDSAQNWTGNDWNQFLKTDEYYKVK
jgi:hypothetical protein